MQIWRYCDIIHNMSFQQLVCRRRPSLLQGVRVLPRRILHNLPTRCLMSVAVLIRMVTPSASGASIPVHLETPADNKVCLGCHDDPNLKKTLSNGQVVSLYVSGKMFSQTVHAVRICTDCHVDTKQIPHRNQQIAKVNCGRCHYVEQIQGAKMPRKPTEYLTSVHKKALAAGNENAPTCQDCHGTHDIHKPSDPQSHVYRTAIPTTCGKCHIEIYADYRESVHGRALLEGNTDVPVCTDCHGEHSIQSPKDPKSSVFPTKIPETCSKCHASTRIEKKYGIPKERYLTYRESYHGVANKYGNVTVANCASCHTAHDIRPSSDPKSSINKKNLPETCGKCHTGANENFAKGKIHVLINKREETLLYYVSNGFKWLTILTMMALVGHIALDLMAKYRHRRSR